MTGDCEYVLRVRLKPDLKLVVRCSLTGGVCFCEGVSRELCTRRTYTLSYETKHPRPPRGTPTPTIQD